MSCSCRAAFWAPSTAWAIQTCAPSWRIDQGADARIANLLTKKVDITCQFMTVTPGRAQQVEFTIPYFTQTTGLLLLKDGKYKSYDELKAAGADLTVSSLQNVFTEEIIHRALPTAKVDQYESQDATVQALNSGRVDVAAIDRHSRDRANASLRRQARPDARIVSLPCRVPAVPPSALVWQAGRATARC